ncbi:hypothetical protein [Bacillus sp. CGMCC 1.16541]|uniref:hypothetical protein n=1 Tax=Bacillus sp. CGMCC 1.16541 TaxID=2185143 RepID=UPI000D7344B1|nr:hypothetical protein [Bacillus sp. CGMCC 1.16541]
MGLMGVLGIIVGVIALISLFYTWVIARDQKKLQGEFDTQLDEKVQAHPYIRNPIFIACLVGIAVCLALIAYMAVIYY